MRQQALDVRDKSEEAYRDYACVHFENMAPAPAKVSTWVWDPDNGEPTRTAGRDGVCTCAPK